MVLLKTSHCLGSEQVHSFGLTVGLGASSAFMRYLQWVATKHFSPLIMQLRFRQIRFLSKKMQSAAFSFLRSTVWNSSCQQIPVKRFRPGIATAPDKSVVFRDHILPEWQKHQAGRKQASAWMCSCGDPEASRKVHEVPSNAYKYRRTIRWRLLRPNLSLLQ